MLAILKANGTGLFDRDAQLVKTVMAAPARFRRSCAGLRGGIDRAGRWLGISNLRDPGGLLGHYAEARGVMVTAGLGRGRKSVSPKYRTGNRSSPFYA